MSSSTGDDSPGKGAATPLGHRAHRAGNREPSAGKTSGGNLTLFAFDAGQGLTDDVFPALVPAGDVLIRSRLSTQDSTGERLIDRIGYVYYCTRTVG